MTVEWLVASDVPHRRKGRSTVIAADEQCSATKAHLERFDEPAAQLRRA
jgi:hypothetical protein